MYVYKKSKIKKKSKTYMINILFSNILYLNDFKSLDTTFYRRNDYNIIVKNNHYFHTVDNRTIAENKKNG